MSKKNNPRTVLVRLVIDEIREGRSGEVVVAAIASDGQKHKIPMDDIVQVEQRQIRGAIAKLRPGEFLADECALSSRRMSKAFQ